MILRNAFTVAGLALVPLAFSSSAAQAVPAPPPAPALHAIAGNADAARANARIYQWKRVNVEVDRIAAAEAALESAGADRPALRAAILTLRSARQAHDSDATMRAAMTVSALCVTLTR